MSASRNAVVSSRVRRWSGLAAFVVAAALAATLGLTAPAAQAAVPSQMHVMSYCAGSGNSGGPITQEQVLARAAAWVRRNVPYSQSGCAHLPGGYYRRDCSGFVSMAWRLPRSLTTWDFDPATNGGDSRFTRVARPALLPGDALVVDNSQHHHIVLFTGWSSNDAGRHRFANLAEESRPGVGTIAITGQDLAGSYWGQFTPIRYVNMTGPSDPSPSCPAYPDVSGSSVFCDDIAWLKGQRITRGYIDGNFRPTASITRQAMAAFLYRLENAGQALPACTSSPYPDVPASSTFCGEIAWLKGQRVTVGHDDGGFQPSASVTRQAMAALLYRLESHGDADPTCTRSPYPDVSTTSTFCGDIAWLKGKHITSGYQDGRYHPKASITRQEMAAFLHRLAA